MLESQNLRNLKKLINEPTCYKNPNKPSDTDIQMLFFLLFFAKLMIQL